MNFALQRTKWCVEKQHSQRTIEKQPTNLTLLSHFLSGRMVMASRRRMSWLALLALDRASLARRRTPGILTALALLALTAVILQYQYEPGEHSHTNTLTFRHTHTLRHTDSHTHTSNTTTNQMSMHTHSQTHTQTHTRTHTTLHTHTDIHTPRTPARAR